MIIKAKILAWKRALHGEVLVLNSASTFYSFQLFKEANYSSSLLSPPTYFLIICSLGFASISPLKLSYRLQVTLMANANGYFAAINLLDLSSSKPVSTS